MVNVTSSIRLFVELAEMSSGASGRILMRFNFQFLILSLLLPMFAVAQNDTNNPGSTNLTMRQFLQLVLERNESVQLRMLELEILRKRFDAEYGAFEPEIFAGVSQEENKRETTAEQRRSIGVKVFEDDNTIYNGGLEGLIPSGAKIRLSYTMRDLNNNLQDPRFPPGTIRTNLATTDEYQTFAGINLTQPLLKSFGYSATMANIRLAALASDIAYQEYRRQLMQTIAVAEAAYWNLYMAQEQVRFFRDSVTLAEGLVRDNRIRAEAGRGSELEILEAEAGLALRRTKLAEAEQKRKEAEMQLMTLYSDPAFSTRPTVVALDRPSTLKDLPDFISSAERAFELNPDYQVHQKKIRQEDIRLAYAKNQRLPQLDLHASYGLNGLGDTPSESHADLERQDYPSFMIGFEFKVPLAGNIRARNEAAAAKMRRQQAILGLKQVEVQIVNGVQGAVQKIRSARDSAENNEKVVFFHRDLLDTQLRRLEVGRVDSRKVLEVEAALFEARNSVLDAMVQLERARLELELIQGATLQARSLDLSQQELQDRTAMLLSRRHESEREIQAFMQALYATPPTPPREVPADSEEMKRARRILREKLEGHQREQQPRLFPPAESSTVSPPPAGNLPK